MAKNELSPSKKGRVTKLSQKSVNELINIILRKDDVERKQTSRINELQNSIASSIKKYCALDENYQKALGTIESTKKSYTCLLDKYDNLVNSYDKLEEDNILLRKICIGSGLFNFILILVLLVMIII